jgi:hypothetical protein
VSASTSELPAARREDPSGRLARQRRMLLWRVQKMTFWVLYDNAGYLIFLNLLTLLFVLGPAWFVLRIPGGNLVISAVTAALLGVMAMAGQATLIKSLLEDEEFSLRRGAQGMVAHGPALIGFAVIFALAEAIGGLGAGFYASQVAPTRPTLGLFLSGFCLSVGFAVLLSGLYVLPALVNQRGPALKALRTSAALAAKHPVLTLGLMVLVAGYGALMATPPGVILFSTLPPVTLVCCAYELLARHYATVPVYDEEDLYLNRGFKDFLFPWKG